MNPRQACQSLPESRETGTCKCAAANQASCVLWSNCALCCWLYFAQVAVGVGAAAAALRTSVSRSGWAWRRGVVTAGSGRGSCRVACAKLGSSRFGSYTRHTPSRAKSAVKKTRAGLQQHRSKASSLSRRPAISRL